MSIRRSVLLGSLMFVSAPVAAQEDAALNRVAYSALARDKELADVDLGVRVNKDGTAVLWGHASKAEAARAEAVLKSVHGISRVVNTCDPIPAADPLVARVAAAFRAPPEPEKPAAPAVVTRHTVMKPPLEDAEPVARLRDPEAAAGPMDYTAITRIRTGDPRFAALAMDLRDGRVVITAALEHQTAAYELAKKIAPLVGNRDVVVARTR